MKSARVMTGDPLEDSLLDKRPVRSEDGSNQGRCFCNHREEAHPCSEEGCACKVFQQRPCICGHVHLGRCRECVCRKLREDRTPEFILRQGLRTGEWGIAALPRLQALMRPEIEPMWRIWACLNVHSMDRRGKQRNSGRLVSFLLDDGKTTQPMTPNDVMAELNALDAVPRLDRHIVRKNLRELERLGWVRVVGSVRKHTRIFLYARPLESRALESIKDPDLGVNPDPQIPLNPTEIDYLHRAVILPMRAALIKNFSRTIRAELKAAGVEAKDFGVNLDPQTLIEKAVDELVLGVQLAYQKVREGVQLAPQNEPAINKERARAPVLNPVVIEVSQSSPETAETRPSETDRPTTEVGPDQVHAYLVSKFKNKLPGERPGDRLCQRIAVIMRGVPYKRLDTEIKRAWKRISSMGLVESLAIGAASAWREEADVLAQEQSERDIYEIRLLRETVADETETAEVRAAAQQQLLERTGAQAMTARR